MSWARNSKPGDKVAVVGEWSFESVLRSVSGKCVLPKAGSVYTVREVCLHPDGHRIGFRLVEIVNPLMDSGLLGWREPAFDSDVFWPVTDRPTDISVFTNILNSVPAKILEVAP